MHENAHLGYKRYKVKKPWFFVHPHPHTNLYTLTHIIFVFFKIFSFFFYFYFLLKAINKQINISKSNKTRLTQNNRNTQEMQDKWMNHLKKYFSFQTGDLEGEETFFFFRLLLRWIRRIKPIKICQEQHNLQKFPKRSQRVLKLILASKRWHTIALLSSKPLIAIWTSVSWCSIMMTKVRFLWLRLLISEAMIVLLSFFPKNLRGGS